MFVTQFIPISNNNMLNVSFGLCTCTLRLLLSASVYTYLNGILISSYSCSFHTYYNYVPIIGHRNFALFIPIDFCVNCRLHQLNSETLLQATK